jgi:hypothetical protein
MSHAWNVSRRDQANKQTFQVYLQVQPAKSRAERLVASGHLSVHLCGDVQVPQHDPDPLLSDFQP